VSLYYSNINLIKVLEKGDFRTFIVFLKGNWEQIELVWLQFKLHCGEEHLVKKKIRFYLLNF